jgi:hypothetical protein
MFPLTRVLLGSGINLLLFTIAFAQVPSVRTASISGRITVSGNPAANAVVTAVVAGPKIYIDGPQIIQANGRESVDRSVYRAVTNGDGSYLITGLPAGQFNISALSPAYLPEDAAQGEDGAKKVTLDVGEARENMNFALIRGGVVTGRVIDDENRPQIKESVRLIQLLDDGDKREVSGKERQTFETDDRGIFRIYGLRAGRYLAYVGGENYAVHGRKFELTYYPDTIEADQAKVIEVKEGSEITGIDIRLVNSGPKYEALGRVTEAETGKAIPQIRVYCIRVAKPEDKYGTGVADALTDIQGNFHMAGLRTGKYKVQLSSWDAENPFYSEDRYFEINSENANGVDLIAKRGGTVSGVAVIEGNKDKAIEKQFYRSNVLMIVNQNDGGNRVGYKQISPDGSFQFIGLPPGKLKLKVLNNDKTFFTHRLERNGITQPDGIDVELGENISGVRVLVVQGDGVIRGEVKANGGSLAEIIRLSVRFSLIGNSEYSKEEVADGKGKFLIEGLLPGEYKVGINYSVKPGTITYQTVDQNVIVTSGAETATTLILNLNQESK